MPGKYLHKLFQLGKSRPFFNFMSLGFLKATDAVVLLLLIPVIISRVGIANFGIIAFVQVILNYGKNIIDYGFQITGVRVIALQKQDKGRLSQLFSDILFTRLVIALIFILAVLLLIQLIPFLKDREWVFYWGFLLPLGHVFFIDWFFIGIQEAHFVAVANLAIKLLFAAGVWWGITIPEDYIFVLALQGGAGLLIGVLSIFATIFWVRLPVKIPSWGAAVSFLRNDFRLLLSNLAIEFNASFSIVMLGFLTSDAITGYFNVMYKLVQPLRFLLVIFAQAIFPKVCEKTKEGFAAVKAFLQKAFGAFFALPILGSVVMILFAEPIYRFFAQDFDPGLLSAFRLYLLVPIIILLNIPAYQILLAYDRKSDYTSVYLISMVVKTVLDFALIQLAGLHGLVISTLVIESFITLGLWWMVKKSHTQLNNHPTLAE